ncbi:hypothetical protein A9Q84_16600 [Halobacteriovorax marinus]|uniref:Biotin transporter n=1 Tax=Halobacteriovorax marinus TaxID=97084 RepID=A0A1Y5FAW8_9BACT|nr:hypothetical protein A9Q84_16600 [Halobacteriovorax marinus]
MIQGTLIDTIWITSEKTNTTVRNITLIVVGSWILAIMAQISFPLPFTPVPITAQTLAVLILGSSLGATRAFAATVLYLLQGAMGLPFFAGGGSGIGVLSGATSGYLFGFVMAAYIMGYLAEKGMDRSVQTSLLIFCVGHIVIYLCGLLVLAQFVGMNNVLTLGLLPFIPGLIIKTILSSIINPIAWKFFHKKS